MPFSFLPRMIFPHLTDVTAEALRALPEDALREIVRFGNAAGSLTTTKGGAIPAMPSMEEIRSCIASAPLL